MRKSVTLSKDLNQDIRAYCKEQGISHSQLIEVATRSYLTLYKATKQLAQDFKRFEDVKDVKKKVLGDG